MCTTFKDLVVWQHRSSRTPFSADGKILVDASNLYVATFVKDDDAALAAFFFNHMEEMCQMSSDLRQARFEAERLADENSELEGELAAGGVSNDA